MKRILFAVVLSLFFYWGFVVGKYRAFPYEFAQNIYWSLKPKVRATGNEVTQFDFFKPKVDVVFLGDSITAGGNWNDMFPNVRLANRGIGGETIQEIELRIDEILALDPKAIFLMAGINDVYRNTSTEEIIESFKRVVSKFIDKGIKVYLQGTLECSLELCGNRRLKQVAEVNKILKDTFLNSEFIFFVDINSTLGSSKGLLVEYSDDGIHLNPTGYVAWRDFIKPYVEAYSSVR
jgi:lysophospholipase L1-like esterase